MSQIGQNQQLALDSDYRGKFWWLVIGAWTILGSIMTSQLVLHRPHTIWYAALVFELLYCAQWVLLLPLTFSLIKRFPFEKRRWVATISVHLGAAILLSAVTMAVRTLLSWFFLDAMESALTIERVTSNMVSAFDYGVM